MKTKFLKFGSIAFCILLIVFSCSFVCFADGETSESSGSVSDTYYVQLCKDYYNYLVSVNYLSSSDYYYISYDESSGEVICIKSDGPWWLEAYNGGTSLRYNTGWISPDFSSSPLTTSDNFPLYSYCRLVSTSISDQDFSDFNTICCPFGNSSSYLIHFTGSETTNYIINYCFSPSDNLNSISYRSVDVSQYVLNSNPIATRYCSHTSTGLIPYPLIRMGFYSTSTGSSFNGYPIYETHFPTGRYIANFIPFLTLANGNSTDNGYGISFSGNLSVGGNFPNDTDDFFQLTRQKVVNQVGITLEQILPIGILILCLVVLALVYLPAFLRLLTGYLRSFL